MRRYELRFCSLVAPDDWVPVPPLGLQEPRPEEVRLSLQAAEAWLGEPMAAADYARRQRDLLARVYEDFELVAESPWPDPRADYALTFEYENDERLTSREMRLYLIRGPHLLSLTLLGPGGTNRSRDQVFEAIARSFEPRGGELFEKAERRPLLPGLESGALPPADPTARREKFPRACVSLAVPRGWEARAEEGQAVLRSSEVEIRLRRVLEHENDAGLWFEGKMQQLRDGGGSLLNAWCQGTLPEGRPYAAILHDETARSRTWTTAAVQRTLEAAIAGRQLLEWSLRAPSSSFQDAQALLQGVIAQAVFLDPAEWETCPVEPWIHLTLRGPWKAQGPGTYTCFDRTTLLLQLGHAESYAPLETLRPRLVNSLRRASKVGSSSETESAGLLRGLEALRWSGQGRMAVRALWLRSGESLYSCLLQGQDAERTEALFLQAVGGLRVPGMRSEESP